MSKNDFYHWSFTEDQIATILHCIEESLLHNKITRYERIKILGCYLEVRDFYHTVLDHNREEK